MLMNSSHRPVPAADYQLETLDNEILLYHPGRTQTLYLNPAASLIWQLCDGRRSIGDITALVAESFPEAAGEIPDHVAQTLESFVEHGAITLEE